VDLDTRDPISNSIEPLVARNYLFYLLRPSPRSAKARLNLAATKKVALLRVESLFLHGRQRCLCLRSKRLSFRPKRADAFSSRSLPANASARAAEKSLFVFIGLRTCCYQVQDLRPVHVVQRLRQVDDFSTVFRMASQPAKLVQHLVITAVLPEPGSLKSDWSNFRGSSDRWHRRPIE